MPADDIGSRRGLTFSQAEGLSPVPKQLDKREMPIRLRSRLWDAISLLLDKVSASNGYTYVIVNPWYSAIRDYYVTHNNQFGDQFKENSQAVKSYVRGVMTSGTYAELFDMVQAILEVSNNAHHIATIVNSILEKELSPYRVYDNSVIAPIASETDAETIRNALDQAARVNAQGPRSHIRNAIQALNNSDFGGSVRESIGAVESVSKLLASDAKAELGTALAILERSTNIHGGMKSAFTRLYGYTSDEKGIRHALLFEDKPDVDEADALFMLGACSAFVTYLITRATQAGISVS